MKQLLPRLLKSLAEFRYSRIKRGAGEIFIATSAGYLVSMGVMPLLTRLYSPDIFGHFATVSAIVTVASLVGSLKLDLAMPVVAEDEIQAILRVGLMSALGAAFFVTAWFSATATNIVVTPGSLGLVSIAILTFLTTVTGLGDALLVRRQNYRGIALRKFAQPTIYSVGQLALSIFQQLGMIMGAIAGRSVGLLVVFSELRKPRRIDRSSSAEISTFIRKHWRYPLIYLPSILLNTLSIQIPLLALFHRYGAAEVGYYTLAISMTTALPSLVASSVSNSLSGEFALRVRNGARYQRSLYLRSTSSLSILGSIFALLTALVLPKLVVPVFGASWSTTASYIPALGILTFTSFAIVPLDCVFAIYERTTAFALSCVLSLCAVSAALIFTWLLDTSAIIFIAMLSVARSLSHIAIWAIGLTIVSTKRYCRDSRAD